jgi:LysR family glycine cleavage system transcriptional activator
VSIGFGDGGWAGLLCESLGPERLFPVCAPSLLHGARPLRRAADLSRHVLLHVADFADWPRWLAAHGAGEGVDPARGAYFGDMSSALAAAEAGQGVAIGRTSLVGRELRSGRLVKPFAGEASDGLGYHLLATAKGARRPHVAAFRAWVLRQRESGDATGPAPAAG